MICKSIFFRAAVGDGRFISLVVVNKTGNSSGNSPAEWIWSDLFSWISYEFGHERCMHWYRNQPSPNIYTGKTHNLKFQGIKLVYLNGNNAAEGENNIKYAKVTL